MALAHRITYDETATRPAHDAAPATAVPGTQASIDLAEVAHLLQLELPREANPAWERYALMRLGPGDALYRSGDPLRSVYAVRSGFFKTSIIRGASEQVLAFPMRGDLVGTEGLGEGVHAADTVALDDSEVVIVPRSALERLALQSPPLAGPLWRLVGRELAHRADLVSLLGTCGAEARVATFLLTLSERFAQLGYSPHWFRLRMTRSDVGNLLGLTHETVTRILTRFDAAGLIGVQLKAVEIRDPAALRELAEGGGLASLMARSRARAAQEQPAPAAARRREQRERAKTWDPALATQAQA